MIEIVMDGRGGKVTKEIVEDIIMEGVVVGVRSK